jgi:hypothetical protein
MSGIVKPGEAGVVELPGMKGTIQIHYDLTRGMVELEARNVAHAHVLQILLVAAQATVSEWAAIDAGIIRPKGQTTDGNQEKNDDENNG